MRNFIIAMIPFCLLFSACKEEQLSSNAGIASFTISELNRKGLYPDTVFVDASNQIISLLFSTNLPQDSFPLTFTADLSLYAGTTSLPASGETITFDSPDDFSIFTLTAEDGSKYAYYCVIRDNQIPNSGFENWYVANGMNGKPYSEPGLMAQTTVWATANHGTSMYGVYCTRSVADGNNKLARIITGETSLIPVTAGTLFTGKFDIDGAISNPTDPRKAVLFGIPFTLRPTAFKFRYTYQPGSRYVKATLKNPSNLFGGFTVNDMEGEDKFTAYVFLEVREGTEITEVGRAELISGDLQEEFREVTVPFVYASSKKPTHIAVVFTSSKDGDLYTGAVGSTLTVDDLELIY
jgi:hypothetical protein